MSTHTVTVKVSAEGEFTEQDLLEAIQATMHEVYPTNDNPVVPRITAVPSSLTRALDAFVAADEPDEREEALAIVYDEWMGLSATA